MAKPPDDLGIVDTSRLTADLGEINRLKCAYDESGQKALRKAVEKLHDNPVLAVRVLGAFFPERFRGSIKGSMAVRRIPEEDIRDIGRKLDPREAMPPLLVSRSP